MSNIIPDAELGSIEVEVPTGTATSPRSAATAPAAATPASPLRQRTSRSGGDRSYGAMTDAPASGTASGVSQSAGADSMDRLRVSSPTSGASHGRKSSLGSSPREKGRLSRQNSALQRGKITESWPGSHHIRRLFRLFDTDGNGTLSPNEFRAGLRSLGFDVSNSSSLARLHREMDKDQSGIIKESEFMAVFRTLNREAIAAKLAASANTPANGYQADSNALPHVPCSIQLVKIGHQKPTSLAAAAAGAKQGSSNSLLSGSNEQYGVNFSLEQDIPLANLAARLEEEQAEVRAQSQSDSSCPAVRWIDVCGFDPNVLNLLSNLYELPHEMLGDEIELETAPHADFYAGSASAAISGGGGDVLRPTKLSSRSSSTAEKKDEDESTQTIPPEGGHPTFKLLIHSLQLINYPLHRDSDGRLTLVSRAHYMKNKPVLQTVPVHVVIANEHTLITCRPWIDPVSASQSSGSVYSAAAAAMNRALTAARLSSGTNDLASADEEDPNQMFADLIETLSETDSTLMGSALGLTTAKQLMLRVVEDVTERNWAIRDEFKEWKIFMGDHVADLNGTYYQLLLRDMESVANRMLRVLKPLVITMASLSDQGDEAGPLTHVKPARHNHSSMRGPPAHSTACSEFLSSVNPQLRLLHRDLNRQLEQATLTAHLITGLQESFVQRGRDRANDTLYLLTVVTTIVTPLQIFAGVYGMNFDNFPELHYENAYYWFWIINIAVIVLIGLAFRFAKLM